MQQAKSFVNIKLKPRLITEQAEQRPGGRLGDHREELSKMVRRIKVAFLSSTQISFEAVDLILALCGMGRSMLDVDFVQLQKAKNNNSRCAVTAHQIRGVMQFTLLASTGPGVNNVPCNNMHFIGS